MPHEPTRSPAAAAVQLRRLALPAAADAGALRSAYDGSLPRRGAAGIAPTAPRKSASLRHALPRGPVLPDGPAADSEAVEPSVRDFLLRLGFDSGAAEARRLIASGEASPAQARVLRYHLRKAAAIDSARELAAKTLASAAREGYSSSALDRALELAAALLALQPLAPPDAWPPEMTTAERGEALDWLTQATAERLEAQLGTLLDLAQPRPDEREAVRRLLEAVLVPLYTDPEIGQNRHAGRALAAALLRHGRQTGRIQIEFALSAKLARRGLRLSDYVGTTLALKDRWGRTRSFELQPGDILGTRSRDLTAAEIAAGARPHWRHWFRAWRQRLLGPIVAIWVDPLGTLGATTWILQGYSHVGLVSVKEADGVVLAWIVHETMDSRDGGIRRDGLVGEFLRSSHVRFGHARLDAEKARAAFLEQAFRDGFQPFPQKASDGAWASGIGPEEHARLVDLARRDAEAFLGELNRLALDQAERLRLLGIAYDFAWQDRHLCASCSSLVQLAYKLGAQFEVQARPDMWHPMAYVLQRLGLPNAKGLRLDRPIVWPGSFFADPKARHAWLELPLDGSAPAFGTAGSAAPASSDRAALGRALRFGLRTRERKQGAAAGWQAGLSDPPPYFAAIERLWLGRGAASRASKAAFPRGSARSNAAAMVAALAAAFLGGLASAGWALPAFGWTWAVPALFAGLAAAALAYAARTGLDYPSAAADYARYHTHPFNRLTHRLGVPLILYAVVQWSQAGAGFFPWAGLFLLLYARWEPRLALAMAGLTAVLAGLAWVLPGWTGLAAFGAGWALQFLGHKFEGRQPAFFTNALHLLVGPLWILSELTGIRPRR